MRISQLNAQNKTCFKSNPKNSALQNFFMQSLNATLEKTPSADTFIKKDDLAQKIKHFFTQYSAVKAFKKRKEKFQISDFLALKAEEIIAIKQKAKKKHIKAADINLRLGLEIKQKLDNTYGKDGYVFISIGTSPSLIAKVLEFQGVEVKYLPISDFGNTANIPLDEIYRKYDFKSYFDFVSQQGINKDAVSKSGKKFVFYDYTYTGETLKKIEQLMTEKMGLDKTKTAFRSINEDLINSNTDNQIVSDYIADYLEAAYAADYSSVRHLPYSQIEKVEITPENFSANDKKDPKFFNFLVMEKLKQMGILRQNPNNSTVI